MTLNRDKMRKIVWIAFLCSLAFISCQQEEWTESTATASGGTVIRLRSDGYDNREETRASAQETDAYDRVEFCVADEDGYIVKGLKGIYDPQSREMKIEGLKEGEYRLLILAVRGDEQADGARIGRMEHMADEWISFPENLGKPLEAEYFYSQTAFSVVREKTEEGYEHEALLPAEIVQKRIMSRMDINLTYNNENVRTAVTRKTLTLEQPRFYTTFRGDGAYDGQSDGSMEVLDLSQGTSFYFMPNVAGTTVEGNIDLQTRRYRGGNAECSYRFATEEIAANRIAHIRARMEHPDDYLGTLFVTRTAYNEGGHARILQDGEPKAVYTDPEQRKFNTARPLQLDINPEGQLHARFYSPRDLKGVLVKAKLPTTDSEYFDLAYFDSIPAFADFYHETALAGRKGMYRTESGKLVEIGPLAPEVWAEMEFKVESDDPYWAKLQEIVHGWDIYFGLYGGDPDLPDGGPAGNWMGIRPVHCREVVALFINFTYMIDMKEHEEILKANEDILYGNGGVNDKVTAEKVLSQMRQERTLKVGLVYTGNGVVGLGGGSTFGAYQHAWLTHYTNTYACEIMFHELGHVMGYNHSSSFTYGPWAQQLMNHFYVDNLHRFPIDSAAYLDSKNNPTLY